MPQLKSKFVIERKASRALGAYVPIGATGEQGLTNWNDWCKQHSKAYRLSSIVYTCVHEIATSAASVPFVVVDKETKKKLTTKSNVSKVLAIPNPLQDRVTFWENMYGFYLLAGNVGMEAAPYQGSKLQELYCIPFNNVSVVLNKNGMVNKYVVKDYRGGKDVEFKVYSTTGKTKFLHLKTFNPDNMWYGLSPLSSAGKDIDLFDSSATWNKNLLQNSARPSGIFSYDDKDGGILPDDEFDRLKAELEKSYTSSINAGRPMLLENVNWQAVSLSPQEMDFLQSRAASARLIANVFGYPSMLLGLSGDNTYNNQKEARLALWTDTIMPLCNKMAIHFTTFLHRLGELPLELEIQPNYDHIGALQPIRDAIWEKACVKGKDILTINERREMIGYERQEGLDGIIANAAQVPLDYALKDPQDRVAVTIIRDNTTKTPNKNPE